jgi:hypothetical protein
MTYQSFIVACIAAIALGKDKRSNDKMKDALDNLDTEFAQSDSHTLKNSSLA